MEKDLLRCSPAVRSLGNLPIGSAVPRTSFLLLDLPLPWPRDVGDDPTLAPVRRAMARMTERGQRWRLQAMVPIAGSPRRRAIAYRLPDGGFDRYLRSAVEVAPSEAIDAAVALVEGSAVPDISSPGDEAELLLCTHGRRDACCGSSGTALWKDLVARPGVLPTSTQLCRTSHTGGHRFAPTAIHLPTGTSWAWLDVDAVEVVTRRSAPFAAVADRYRGSCALASPAEQVLEHAVLTEVGWPWLDCTRRGTTTGQSTRPEASLRYRAPDGARGVWTAALELVGRAPVPDCGAPLDAAPKLEDMLRIVPGTLRHEAAIRPPLSQVEI